MSLKNVFNRIKREIGIKHCIIIEGNVGDIYLDEKGQILDLKEYLKNILDEMDYDNVICWDKVEGTKDDISGLELVDNIEVQGETYIDDDISEIVEQKIDTREVKDMFSSFCIKLGRFSFFGFTIINRRKRRNNNSW